MCNQNKALSFLIILSMLKFEVTANYTLFIIALMSPTFFLWPESIKLRASLFSFFWRGVPTIKVKDITRKNVRETEIEKVL
jgi:hypothetical protein